MKLRSQILVFLQFAGIGITSIEAAQSVPPLHVLYLAIAFSGALLGIVTLCYNRIGNFNISPILRKNARLITRGPYRFVRHPMYLSVGIVLLGLSLQAGTLAGWAGFCIAASAMAQKSVIEEQFLLTQFPEYKAYQTTTKRIVPFVY